MRARGVFGRVTAPGRTAAALLVVALGAAAAGCAGDEPAPDPAPTTEARPPAPGEAPAPTGDAPPFSEPRAKIAPGEAKPEDEEARRRVVR